MWKMGVNSRKKKKEEEEEKTCVRVMYEDVG